MSPPTFLSREDLGAPPHLSVGDVQVLGVGSIPHNGGQAIQQVGFIVAQVQGRKLWWGKRVRTPKGIPETYLPVLPNLSLPHHWSQHWALVLTKRLIPGWMCMEAAMPFLQFCVIPMSQVIKSPGSQDEGYRDWEGPSWNTSSTNPSPWYHLWGLYPDRPSTLTCPTITAVAIPGPKQSLWMSRDCWQASYGLFMVSCRVRDGVQWFWVWGWVGGSSGSGCECTVYAESALPLSAPPFQTSAPSAQTGVTHRVQPR